MRQGSRCPSNPGSTFADELASYGKRLVLVSEQSLHRLHTIEFRYFRLDVIPFMQKRARTKRIGLFFCSAGAGPNTALAWCYFFCSFIFFVRRFWSPYLRYFPLILNWLPFPRCLPQRKCARWLSTWYLFSWYFLIHLASHCLGACENVHTILHFITAVFFFLKARRLKINHLDLLRE